MAAYNITIVSGSNYCCIRFNMKGVISCVCIHILVIASQNMSFHTLAFL
jgi:hypothetical protein